MSLRSLGRRVAAVGQRHGAAAGAKLLGLVLARKLAVVEHVHILKLRVPPKPPRDEQREVRLASVSELGELARDASWDLSDLDEQVAERLYAAGHRCVLNLVRGRVAGYAWMNPNRLVVPRVRAAFELLAGELHIYKGFTHPRHRGNDLGMDRFAFWLRTHPAATLVTDFSFDNFATLARIERLGLRRLGSASYIARGPIARRVLSPALASRRLEPIAPDLPHRDH